VVEEVFLVNPEIEIRQEQELAFHQIHFGRRKEGGIFGPVLVLWRRIIQVLGRDNESGEKHAMPCAMHALGNLRQARLQAIEVHEGTEQGRYLNV